MPPFRLRTAVAFLAVLGLLAPFGRQTPAAFAAEPEKDADKIPAAYIQVTASRIPEDVEPEPASITIISGDDMRARGAVDLVDALALVGGVSMAPGGDNGPAASVPEIWGLREFDAFLLVVDGVPWGGAFNPDLASLSLEGVERIEILRGAAPVMYGATSFTGVIQVIHKDAGKGDRTLRVSGGSYASGAAAVTSPLPAAGAVLQSVTGDITRLGYPDDRTVMGRGHLLYRLATPAGEGRFHLDFDASGLRQQPASPLPRVGTSLTDLVPIDSNNNPADAHLDQNKFHLVGGYDRDIKGGSFSTMLSVTHTRQDIIRGFLTDVSTVNPNAAGFTQDVSILDSYFDIHVALHPATDVRLVAGLDNLYGKAHQNSKIYDYFVNLDGSDAPDLTDQPVADTPEASDRRDFSGLYAQCEWTPKTRLRFEIGVRVNHTQERREVPDTVPETDSKTVTRGSGVAGVSWLAWAHKDGGVWLYGDYRNTFKPAAFDFGPDPTTAILDPETAVSYEIGLKGRHGEGRFSWQFSAFQMDFSNLVISNSVGGLPTLINGGDERFRGLEVEGSARLPHDFLVRGAFSLHDARFTDSVQDFGGVPTQLAGNRLEMTARNMAAAGLTWMPAKGWMADTTINYVGSRYLDKRNNSLAAAYTAWNAGVGYRFAAGTVRVDGWNLGDTRPPVSESELGDAQYYLLTARAVTASWFQKF
jgi:iron complex outermembrane receptor protein